MARDHARIWLDIWADSDWASLSSVQQLAYLALISSRDLSYAGVLPYLPARYALLASDWTERKFAAAIAGLESKRFVVVDRSTAELLIRSYVRHDGLLKQPNVTKALVTALKRVHSTLLVEAIETELARLLVEDPDAKGWKGYADVDPEGFQNLMAKAYPNPSPKGSENPRATPFPLPLSPSSSPLPTPHQSARKAGA